MKKFQAISRFALLIQSRKSIASLLINFSILKKADINITRLYAIVAISSIADIFALAVIIPIVRYLSSGELSSNGDVADTGFSSTSAHLYLLISAFFIFSTLAFVLRIYSVKIEAKNAKRLGSFLFKASLQNYLNKSYVDLRNKHSSEIITSLVVYINEYILHIFKPLLDITRSVILVFSFGFLLLLQSPFIGSILIIFVLTSYSFYYLKSRTSLDADSDRMPTAKKLLMKKLSESALNIRSIKLDNLEDYSVSNSSTVDEKVRDILEKKNLKTLLPKIFIEYLVVISVVAITISSIMFLSADHIQKLLPTLAFILLASQKVIPSVQRMFQNLVDVKLYNKSAVTVHENVINAPISANKKLYSQNSTNVNTQKINKSLINSNYLNDKNFQLHTLSLNNISYVLSTNSDQNPNERIETILADNINVQFNSGEFIALIGKSGSGKSTLVDIISGLTPPNSGTIKVNQRDLDSLDLKSIRAWQKKLAYVSQRVLLDDTTVSENITFGMKDDPDALQLAVDSSSLLTNAISQNILQHRVGEGGAFLSGGQRQRLGIARALYKKPQLLILDEATAALDSSTERQVLQSIKRNYNNICVIVITHRAETLRHCNRFLCLKDGRICQMSHEEAVNEVSI